MNTPDKNSMYPLPDFERLCFLKNIVTHPNILVGDYTYYHDFEDVANFEKNVRYLFDFIGDKLIIGKFCMIASGAKFIMNGANHLSNALSSYPFSVFGGAWSNAMEGKEFPFKGDLRIGNDVWIGLNSTIMGGITIGDGVIIAANSTVVRDVPPYSIVGGNPAQIIRMRFSDEKIKRLLNLKWWDWDIDKITRHVQHLTDTDIDVLEEIQ